MELYRLGIKFFAEDARSIQLSEFIPVFHGWIQKRLIEDHVLIDVHNYSHISQGPGILLVGHQGNFSFDLTLERPGLLYYRKQPVSGFADIVKPAVQACRLLEEESSFRNRLRFTMHEALIVSNDRLAAPNNAETLASIESSLNAGLEQTLKSHFKLAQVSNDPKERLTIRATSR